MRKLQTVRLNILVLALVSTYTLNSQSILPIQEKYSFKELVGFVPSAQVIYEYDAGGRITREITRNAALDQANNELIKWVPWRDKQTQYDLNGNVIKEQLDKYSINHSTGEVWLRAISTLEVDYNEFGLSKRQTIERGFTTEGAANIVTGFRISWEYDNGCPARRFTETLYVESGEAEVWQIDSDILYINNADCQVLEQIHLQGGEEKERTKYQYDSQGLKIKEVSLPAWANRVTEQNFTYEGGQLSTWETLLKYPDDTARTLIRFEYDDQNRKIGENRIEYNADHPQGVVTRRLMNSYDQASNLIETESFSCHTYERSTGLKDTSCTTLFLENIYADDGLLQKEKTFVRVNEDGQLADSLLTTRYYDYLCPDRGLIKQTYTIAGPVGSTDTINKRQLYYPDFFTCEAGLDNEADLVVFPNPVQGSLTIYSDALRMLKGTLTVVDAIGRIVFQNTTEGLDVLRINTLGWASGVYTVSFKSGGETYKSRFIVQ